MTVSVKNGVEMQNYTNKLKMIDLLFSIMFTLFW